jgi:aspartyl-tRNA synthetase
MDMLQIPPRTEIADLTHHIGERIRVCGFVETIRDQKRMQFLILRDGTGRVQMVPEKSDDGLTTCLQTLTPESTVAVTGRLVATPAVKLGGVEIVIEAIDIHSIAETPLPIAADSTLEKQMDWRQVSLRSPQQQLAFRVQTTLEQAMREFWMKERFVELHSPKLMGTFSESGAEAFRVGYFDRTAYLAQSPQFYKQMAIAGGFERVFEIGPVFRAEPSFTTRHETEFTSVDMEIAWIDSHAQIMALEEQWLIYALGKVAARHGEDIAHVFGHSFTVPSAPFPKISVTEAHAILKKIGHPPLKDDDMDSDSERRIAEYAAQKYGHEFLFITDYPVSARAFYHMRHEESPHLTKGFDLLWKGLEVTTGAQREHRYDRLLSQARERGYALEPLRGYLDFFRYGCPPHGGLGVGVARLLMRILGVSTIRDVTLVSRTPNRLLP